MSRRRYISTEISLDMQVNRLAADHGDFAALLYTWMIPHAQDDATIHGDVPEILWRVIPGRRDKTEEDVAAALEGMEKLGLIVWNRSENLILFPPGPFYRYQSYVKEENRRHDTPQNGGNPGDVAEISAHPESSLKSAENAEENNSALTSAENASSVSLSSSVSPSLSFSVSVSPGADEPERVLSILDPLVDEPIARTDTTKAGVWKSIQGLKHLDPLEVAIDYVRWQETLPPKKRHKDPVRGWRNQMQMRRDNEYYCRPSPHTPDAALPMVPVDMLERAKRRTALIEANSA